MNLSLLASPNFKELTVFFNKETDLLAWKAVNRQRRENTTLGVFFSMDPGILGCPPCEKIDVHKNPVSIFQMIKNRKYKHCYPYLIGSMYDMFTCIYRKNQPNIVDINTRPIRWYKPSMGLERKKHSSSKGCFKWPWNGSPIENYLGNL